VSKQLSYLLPKNWQWKALGEVATLINGRAYKKHELLDKGTTPVLRVGNFFSNRSWYYSDLELPNNKYCHKGDLLYAWSASFGPKIWDGEKAIFHYHIWKVVTSKYIDKYYLFYLLVQDSEEIKSSGNGIAIMHATKGGMEKRLIPLPPLAEQQKIAAILDAADVLRQKDQQLIDHYTTLSQSLFLDMFGDPVTNPMGWDTMKLQHLAEFENGDRSSNYPSGDDIKQSGVLFLSTKNITDNKLDLTFTQFISNRKFTSLSRGKAIHGDLLITLRGTLGSCGIFNGIYDKAFINAQIMIIRVNENTSNIYLHSLITVERFNLMLQLIGRGAAVPQLTAAQLKGLDIPLPPITLQNQFAERIQHIEAQKQQAQASLEQSNNLFNSLLQKAFTGELTEEKES